MRSAPAVASSGAASWIRLSLYGLIALLEVFVIFLAGQFSRLSACGGCNVYLGPFASWVDTVYWVPVWAAILCLGTWLGMFARRRSTVHGVLALGLVISGLTFIDGVSGMCAHSMISNPATHQTWSECSNIWTWGRAN